MPRYSAWPQVRLLALVTMTTVHLAAGVALGLAAYGEMATIMYPLLGRCPGCMELRSLVLQQSFLAVEMSDILELYIR